MVISDNKILYVLAFIFLSVGGLVSTDIFLPALDEMAHFYHVTSSQIQNGISIFLLAVGVSQLFYGPLSDSIGRKLRFAYYLPHLIIYFYFYVFGKVWVLVLA